MECWGEKYAGVQSAIEVFAKSDRFEYVHKDHLQNLMDTGIYEYS